MSSYFPPLSLFRPNYPAFSRSRHLRRFLSLAFGSLLCVAHAAAPLTLEERVRALEAHLEQLTRENTVLKNQLGLAAANPPALVTAAGREARLSLGGYIQAHSEFGAAPDTRFVATDRFYLRRARITLKGSFAEHFGFTLQSDLGANSIGAVSASRAQATDAFITWHRHETATLTVGQFKTPYGYEQLLPDTKLLANERSLPNDQLTFGRQLGAMVSGAFRNRTFTYSAGLFNGNGVNTSANDNDNFLYVGRLTFVALQTPAHRLGLGAAAFSTRDTGAFTGRRDGAQLDTQFNAGRFDLNAEYFRTRFDRLAGPDATAHGWALLAGYFVVPQTLQAIVRYETFDPSRALSGDRADLWTFGFNHRFKADDIMLSVNYLLGDPAGPRHREERLTTRLQLVF